MRILQSFIIIIFLFNLVPVSCTSEKTSAPNAQMTQKDSDTTNEDLVKEKTESILFFGNSLTAGGKNRIDWVLKNNDPTIFILELGGNDGLRGIDPSSSKDNLQSIIDVVKAKNPNTKILLAGMEAPPNMGSGYTSSFRKIYSELAKENDVNLIPFLLDRVGGIKAYNQADGIHPNEAGQVLVAENIWKYLEPMI